MGGRRQRLALAAVTGLLALLCFGHLGYQAYDGFRLRLTVFELDKNGNVIPFSLGREVSGADWWRAYRAGQDDPQRAKQFATHRNGWPYTWEETLVWLIPGIILAGISVGALPEHKKDIE